MPTVFRTTRRTAKFAFALMVTLAASAFLAPARALEARSDDSIDETRQLAEQREANGLFRLAHSLGSGDESQTCYPCAWALYDVASQGKGVVRDVARANRDDLGSYLSDADLAEGQQLSTAMQEPGRLLSALDAYRARKKNGA